MEPIRLPRGVLRRGRRIPAAGFSGRANAGHRCSLDGALVRPPRSGRKLLNSATHRSQEAGATGRVEQGVYGLNPRAGLGHDFTDAMGIAFRGNSETSVFRLMVPACSFRIPGQDESQPEMSRRMRRLKTIQPVVTRFQSFAEAEAADRAWQRSLSPLERLRQLELARQYAYGPSVSQRRLPRVPNLSQ